MSHEIAGRRFTYVGEPAWHQIGDRMPEGSTALEGVRACRADFRVELRKTWFAGPDGQPIESKDWMSTVPVADDPAMLRGLRAELGRVGKSYRPLQNEAAAGILDKVDGVTWETCGVLRQGRVFFVSGRLAPAAVRRAYGHDDPISRFLTLANWHDGVSRARVYLSGVRTVCSNTLAAGLAANDDAVAIRHVGNVEAAMEAAVDAVGLAVEGFDKALERWEALDRVRIQPTDAEEYFAVLADDAKHPGASAERTKQIIDEMAALFTEGAGNHGETAYDALQAVTDWVAHKRGVGRRAANELAAATRQAEDMLVGTGRGLLRKANKVAMKRWA